MKFEKIKSIIRNIIPDFIYSYLSFKVYLHKWKKKNRNNKIEPTNYIPFDCVFVGDYSYGKLKVLNCRNDVNLQIGKFCSIADGVTFLLSVDHYLDRLSTYPFKTMFLNEGYVDSTTKGDIIIGDDVWIGYGATIMSGVTIERGAVVAAGAVVTNNIPPFAIVGGVPAKVIRYRFSQDVISKLMQIDYSKIDDAFVKTHIDELSSPLSNYFIHYLSSF